VSHRASAGACLLGPADVRRLATELGVRPRKKLGQNFVHDPNTVRRIVAAAGLRAADVVLEVGPGLGSLTLGLLDAAGPGATAGPAGRAGAADHGGAATVAAVVAVELDTVLAAALPATVAERAPERAGALRVLAADALRVRAGDLPGPPPTALVANLPYNVAVPVLLHLLAELPSLAHGLVMVQAEVADRLAAEPGSRVYGVPSVKAAWYAAVRRAGAVPRAVFWPVPNVDSGLVSFLRRPPPPGASREATFAAVDAAFAQRRKTLRAALTAWAGSAAAAEAVLRAAGVDPAARGERLDVAAFARIAAARNSS